MPDRTTLATHRCPLCGWAGTLEGGAQCPTCGHGVVAYRIEFA